jgi:hypothetical protein
VRLYTAQVSAVAVSALQDLFEIAAPADAIVIIHGWSLLQTSDLGDAAEEVLRIETVRGVGATTGSGGSTVTPQPVSDGDPAFGGVVEANNTARMTAGGGSLEVLEQYGWNVRIPWVHLFPPELRPVISPSQHFTLALPAAPADEITFSGTITFEEIGG